MMYLRWLLITVYAIATTLLAMILTPFAVWFMGKRCVPTDVDGMHVISFNHMDAM